MMQQEQQQEQQCERSPPMHCRGRSVACQHTPQVVQEGVPVEPVQVVAGRGGRRVRQELQMKWAWGQDPGAVRLAQGSSCAAQWLSWFQKQQAGRQDKE